MKIPAFAKTIRFTLTIWYSLLLLIFVVLFVIGLNIVMKNFVPISRFSPWPELVRQVQLENMEMVRNYSMIGLGSLLVLGAGSGYFLSGRMLKPVDRVTSLAARISSTNLNERINYNGPDDEIKRLADTFDGMLERLQGAFDSQKQFIQDASHELRTPIAIVQTNIEVMEMEEDATVKDYKRLMGVILLSVERLRRLSDDLLLLSQGEPNQARWSNVDMAHLIGEAMEEASAQAIATGVSLEVAPTNGELSVRGDRLSLKQAITNLIDNAIKYNIPDGKVRVASYADGGKLIIRVEDNGVGISLSDQKRIFDRFYRADRSRSRAQGGSGLGLSIVKRIVEDHGGTISVESEPGKGSVFKIVLPLMNVM